MPIPPAPSITILDHPIRSRAVKMHIDRPEKYSHVIGAWRGYDTAKFSIGTTMDELGFWFNALGYRVQVTAPALNMVWDGFIDEVRMDAGPLSYNIGPLMDIGNQLLLIWSRTQEYWDMPTGSTNYHGVVPTSAAQASQDRYGVIWKALNAGACTLNGSSAVAEMFYRNRLYPQKSWDLRSGRGRAPSVDVLCKGYVHWLNWYIDDWDDFWLPGYEYTNEHISRILTYNPNSSWLDIDETYIQENAHSVPDRLPPDMTALEQIDETILWGEGEPDYERWLFGMYNNFQLHYYPIPTDIEYEIHLEDERFAVQSAAGGQGRVWPWDVRPGKWAMLANFLPGLTLPADYQDDPRIGFIDEVVYTAPQTIQLKGADFDRLEQFLSYWGLRGQIGI